MDNTYTITDNDLKKILTDIETIIENVDTFNNKYGNYSYHIKITNNNNLWNAEVNIENEK